MKRAWITAALSSLLIACVGDGFQSDYTDPGDTTNCRASDVRTVYADVDMDGYGDPDSAMEGCLSGIAGFVDNGGDCDDTQPLVYEGATDLCGDKVDNDCSGQDACADSLMGHWTFAETSGELTSDESGHLLNGTLLNGLLHTAGAGLVFDGADDYIEVADSPMFQLSEGTVSTWFMPTLAQVDQAILSKDSNGNDAGGHMSIYFDANGSVRARIQSANDDYEVASLPVALNQWHHVAFTFGGNAGMTLYIDDVEVGKNPYTGGLIRNEEPLVIGAGTDNSGNQEATPINRAFGGQIAQVQVYERQLLRAELTSLKLVSDPRTSGL
jgi:hypothetical protein